MSRSEDKDVAPLDSIESELRGIAEATLIATGERQIDRALLFRRLADYVMEECDDGPTCDENGQLYVCRSRMIGAHGFTTVDKENNIEEFRFET
jgi:hypothetical protein